jgi:hypothetical protein
MRNAWYVVRVAWYVVRDAWCVVRELMVMEFYRVSRNLLKDYTTVLVQTFYNRALQGLL